MDSDSAHFAVPAAARISRAQFRSAPTMQLLRYWSAREGERLDAKYCFEYTWADSMSAWSSTDSFCPRTSCSRAFNHCALDGQNDGATA